MQLIMLVRVLDAADGRLRMDDRLVRRYVDRVPSGRFDAIASPAYTFTHADATSNGMRGIMENLVVIGSLAGLVAIYFANSGN